MPTDAPKEFITIKEYCEREGYDPRHIRKLIHANKLEAYRSQERGRWKVRADQVVEWVRPKDKSKPRLGTSAIELTRAKHWFELADTATLFLDFWEQYGLSHPDGGYDGYIIDDPQFERIDVHLANSLMSHLKAEFTEFTEVKEWRNLVSIDLNTDVFQKITLVAQRRTFKGKCPICQSM